MRITTPLHPNITYLQIALSLHAVTTTPKILNGMTGQVISPYYRLSKLQNGPNYLAIQMFNKLPSNIRNIENLKIFRTTIKSFLIGKAFYHYKEFLECDILTLKVPSVSIHL